MKIAHICLAATYVEGFGYQENILTQLHSEMGNEVVVLTSNYVFNSKYEKVEREEKDYVNDFGVHVRVLQQSKRYGYYSRYNDFDGVYDALKLEKPDIIFVHGGQFVALKDVIVYCKKYRQVKLYIDQHGDYYNTKVNTFKSRMAQYWIYGHWMRKAIPFVQIFWGVTPWRCQYLHDVYGIPERKIDLLVMGGDDRYIHMNQMPKIREEVRDRLKLQTEDFVVITGGKIDTTKNIHLLMQAIIESGKDDLKLIVFGQANDDMKQIIERLSKNEHIRYIGWLESAKVYDFFLAADLAVFPGTHSVLWEQACACGIPGLFKEWPGMNHVNVNGSAEFLLRADENDIKTKLLELYDNKDKYLSMKNAAQNYAVTTFSYADIARRAIGLGL